MQDDAISRKEVLKPYKDLKDDDVISVWLIRKNIEQQKSVQPSRKGHWIDEGQYAEGHSHHAYRCSECGQHIIELPSRLMDENPHCKYCGAKMDMRGAE